MTPTRDDRIAELLIRHHLGMFDADPKVRDRLALIFERNPADALERLERACEHLGITGHDLEHLANLATARLAGVPADRLGAPSSAIDKASYQTHAPSEGGKP